MSFAWCDAGGWGCFAVVRLFIPMDDFHSYASVHLVILCAVHVTPEAQEASKPSDFLWFSSDLFQEWNKQFIIHTEISISL